MASSGCLRPRTPACCGGFHCCLCLGSAAASDGCLLCRQAGEGCFCCNHGLAAVLHAAVVSLELLGDACEQLGELRELEFKVAGRWCSSGICRRGHNKGWASCTSMSCKGLLLVLGLLASLSLLLLLLLPPLVCLPNLQQLGSVWCCCCSRGCICTASSSC